MLELPCPSRLALFRFVSGQGGRSEQEVALAEVHSLGVIYPLFSPMPKIVPMVSREPSDCPLGVEIATHGLSRQPTDRPQEPWYPCDACIIDKLAQYAYSC